MFIFLRLLLAHFIGDFPLQFNKVFALKLKGLKGGIPHALFVTASFIFFSWPYLNMPAMWAFIIFLGSIHLVQDRIKLMFKKIKFAFWFYILDQLMHVGTICLVFLTDLKNAAPPIESNPFVAVYNNDLVILYFIAAIFVTYNGFFLIRNFKDSLLGRIIGPFHAYEKWYGMAERLVLLTIFLLGNCYFLLIPAVLFVRPFIAVMGKKPLNLSHKVVNWMLSWVEILLSWTVGLGTGAALYIITRLFILVPPPCK